MREILFRGKTIKQNKGVTTEKPIKENMWVYGNLTVGEIEGYKADMISNKKEIYYIDSNTVGQYTGIKDKNGKKIFEGDIVKDLGGYMDGIPRVVVWEEETMEFETYLVKNHWAYGTNRVSLWCIKDRELEVIGNIHDNKELLGE